MKKFLSIALALMLVLTSSACKKSKSEVNLIYDRSLTCDENGDFTILVVSDPQCDNATQWSEARNELETLVERADPNLVLINGDMNSENEISVDLWDSFVSPLTQRGIFWATTNGNHDPFKNEYFQLYSSYSNCLNSTVSTQDANFEPTRPMNYVIPIYSSDGTTPVFAVYGMDTGTSNSNGYEGLTAKQITWYETRSEALKKLNGGSPVTSLLCMHIPLPQTIDLYYGDTDIYGIVNEPDGGMENYLCEDGTEISGTGFYTTAPENDRGMFGKILEQGDIKAVFFGHDHQTNFAGSYKGVLLGFVGKLSTGCYSDDLCRGGRVIQFNQSNPEKFTTSWLASLNTAKDQPPIYSDGSLAG